MPLSLSLQTFDDWLGGRKSDCACVSPCFCTHSSALVSVQTFDDEPIPLSVWTSTLKRTIQTASYLPFPKLRCVCVCVCVFPAPPLPPAPLAPPFPPPSRPFSPPLPLFHSPPPPPPLTGLGKGFPPLSPPTHPVLPLPRTASASSPVIGAGGRPSMRSTPGRATTPSPPSLHSPPWHPPSTTTHWAQVEGSRRDQRWVMRRSDLRRGKGDVP